MVSAVIHRNLRLRLAGWPEAAASDKTKRNLTVHLDIKGSARRIALREK